MSATDSDSVSDDHVPLRQHVRVPSALASEYGERKPKRNIQWAVELETVYDRTASLSSEESSDDGGILGVLGGGRPGASGVTPTPSQTATTQGSSNEDKDIEGTDSLDATRAHVSGPAWNSLGGGGDQGVGNMGDRTRGSDASSRSSTDSTASSVSSRSSKGSRASTDSNASTDSDASGLGAGDGKPARYFAVLNEYGSSVLTVDKLRTYDESELRTSFELTLRSIPMWLARVLIVLGVLYALTQGAIMTLEWGWMYPASYSSAGACIRITHDTSDIPDTLGDVRFIFTIISWALGAPCFFITMFFAARSSSLVDSLLYTLFAVGQNKKFMFTSLSALISLMVRQVAYPPPNHGTLSLATHLALVLATFFSGAMTDVVAMRGGKALLKSVLFAQWGLFFNFARSYARLFIDCPASLTELTVGEAMTSAVLNGSYGVLLIDFAVSILVHSQKHQWWAPSAFRFNTRRASRNDFIGRSVDSQRENAMLFVNSYFCDVVIVEDGDEQAARVRAPPGTSRGDIATMYRRPPSVKHYIHTMIPRQRISKVFSMVMGLNLILASVSIFVLQVAFISVSMDGYDETQLCIRSEFTSSSSPAKQAFLNATLWVTYILVIGAIVCFVYVAKVTVGRWSVLLRYCWHYYSHSIRLALMSGVLILVALGTMVTYPEFAALSVHSVTTQLAFFTLPILDIVYLRGEKSILNATTVSCMCICVGWMRFVIITKTTCLPHELTPKVLMSVLSALVANILIEIIITFLARLRPSRWFVPTFKFRRTFMALNCLVADHPAGPGANRKARDSKMQYMRMRKMAARNAARSSSQMSNASQRTDSVMSTGSDIQWNTTTEPKHSHPTPTPAPQVDSESTAPSTVTPLSYGGGYDSGDPLDSLGSMGFAMDTGAGPGGGDGFDPLDDIDLEL